MHPTVAHLLIEFLITVGCSAPKVVRKFKGNNNEKNYFANKLFPLFVQMMCRVQEDPEWDTLKTSEEEDEGEEEGDAKDCDVGETALDRLCQSLGLRTTYTLASTQLVQLFTSNQWQQQYVGLRYLGNYVEVSKNFTEKKQLTQHRREVLSVVTQFSQHPVQRVRAAAYYALNQFLIMHGSNILFGANNKQSASVEQHKLILNGILPGVLQGLSAKVNPAPRVRRYVLACLINLIDLCIPQSALEQTATSSSLTGSILGSVVGALNEGPLMIQEYCISIIMSLSETMRGNSFAQFYDPLMPVLKKLLQYTQAAGLEKFWGSVIECIAMVGESSGKAKFYGDAMDMMNHLASITHQVDEESEIRSYILRAWVRLA